MVAEYIGNHFCFIDSNLLYQTSSLIRSEV